MANVMMRVTNESNIVYMTCAESGANEVKEMFEKYGAQVEILTYPIALDKLPEEVQAKVKSILKAFDEVNVTYEYGKFEVSACSCLCAYYHYDRMYCGRYTSKEVYTAEERKQNFFESFGYYPCHAV